MASRHQRYLAASRRRTVTASYRFAGVDYSESTMRIITTSKYMQGIAGAVKRRFPSATVRLSSPDVGNVYVKGVSFSDFKEFWSDLPVAVKGRSEFRNVTPSGYAT